MACKKKRCPFYRAYGYCMEDIGETCTTKEDKVMKLETLVNDIKVEFIELCCHAGCDDCKLNVSPACCIWYAFRYLENHGMVRKGYIGLENDICNKYYNEEFQVSFNSKYHVYAKNTVLKFVTWLNENGYLKGVE